MAAAVGEATEQVADPLLSWYPEMVPQSWVSHPACKGAELGANLLELGSCEAFGEALLIAKGTRGGGHKSRPKAKGRSCTATAGSVRAICLYAEIHLVSGGCCLDFCAKLLIFNELFDQIS